MNLRRDALRLMAVPLLTLGIAACGGGADAGEEAGPVTLRLGYFPNITHSQPLVGLADGTYEEALGDEANLETVTFNAGPSAIEALFAGEIDATYIGPNPAINGYVQSDGEALRIVAGATSAGARFIVAGDSGIETVEDLAGHSFATPQLGNTQDVALRAYLEQQGYEVGRDVEVVPTANPDILTLMQNGQIDGAWVPEPWATRLEQEAEGLEFLDEREIWPNEAFVTTHLIVSTEFLEEHPEIVRRLIEAHVQVTQAINADPEGARDAVNAEIERVTSAALPGAVIDAAWEEIDISWDPVAASLVKSAEDAYALGYLEQEPDLSGIYALDLLNEVLAGLGLDAVEGLAP